MTHESSVERAREILQQLQAIDPTKVHCMMGMVVVKSSDNENKATAHAFVLGSDEDIAKMFSSLITIIHNNEVKH